MSRFADTLVRLFPVPKYLDVVYPALDISQSAIKYMRVERRSNWLVPTEHEEKVLPEGSIVEGGVHDQEPVIAALRTLAAAHRITHAVVTLPEEHAYIFPIQVRGTTQEEIRVEVEFAMSEHVPIPLEHVVYMFERVGNTLVSVVAYDARVRNEYEEMLLVAGITPISFVPHVVASARATILPVQDAAQLMVDIGRTRSSVALVYNGCVLGSATTYTGTKRLLEALVSRGLSIEDAAIQLQTDGLAADNALIDVWHEVVMSLGPYIDLWREGRCNDTITVPAPGSIVISGGGVSISGVVDACASAYALPVTVPNVWQRLFPVEQFPPMVLERDSHRFASVAGLLLANA